MSCNTEMRYIDKNGLLYLLELLHKGIDMQIVDAMFNGAISDGKLEQRIQRLADEDLIITKAELQAMAESISDETDAKLDALHTKINQEVAKKSKEAALSVIDSKLDEEIDSKLSEALNDSNLKSKLDGYYVNTSGDTMTGALTTTQVTAGKFVTSSGIIFY